MPGTIYTIGHSTHTLEAFVALLEAHGIEAVADVRRYPRSRRMPHFNDDALATELPRRSIRYVPFAGLGGRRRPRKDSVNTGWRTEGFRGYADYMMTSQFEQHLAELTKLATQTPTAIMCAEALPWRCHRSLIADALLVRGWQVLDVMNARQPVEHKLTPFARVADGRLTYPGAQKGESLF